LKKSDPETKAPKHLSREAQGVWKAIVAEYELEDRAGLLLLQTALEAFDRMREAQAAIADKGALTEDRWGQLKSNPACVIERDSRSAMLAALKALNLDLEPLRDRMNIARS
jgi:P27 family predicted phage terminase small subunit